MKIFTFKLVIALITLLASSVHLRAQERKVDFYEEGSRAHTFNVEAGGPGFLSINYDRRFSKTRDGLGIRGGIGYIDIDDDTFFTIPVQVNYLLGKKGHYLEVGAGASFVRDRSWIQTYTHYGNGNYSDIRYYRQYENQIMGTFTLGYRKQPVNGGLTIRAGISPIIYEGSFIPYLTYFSLGYSF